MFSIFRICDNDNPASPKRVSRWSRLASLPCLLLLQIQTQIQIPSSRMQRPVDPLPWNHNISRTSRIATHEVIVLFLTDAASSKESMSDAEAEERVRMGAL